MNWDNLISNKRIRVGKARAESDIRRDFESDFGRIIFSPALRRMHDKTQVFPLTTDDNIHTRLTHSNEVMSIGFTFGLNLCESKKIRERLKGKSDGDLYRIFPTLLKNICLIHDIGNAPFGHFAEKTFSNYFENLFSSNKYFIELIRSGKFCEHKQRDFLFYDGNAQGLRVLTKLQLLNDVYGLNLTIATLAAYLKYPNYNKNKRSNKYPDGSEYIGDKKHGVFYSELSYFETIMSESGLTKDVDGTTVYIRHPLCYLMEAADSIAYLCMDLEDGYNKKLVSLEVIDKIFSKRIMDSTLLAKLKDILNSKDNSNSKIVSIRIKLISYLVNLAFSNFENNLERIEKGDYNKELIEDSECGTVQALKELTNSCILNSREVNYLESTGYSVITGILDFYIDFIFNKKSKDFAKRATTLISNSIIECAIEENIETLCQRKIEMWREQESIGSCEADIPALEEYLKVYRELNGIQQERDLTKEERENYLDAREMIVSKFCSFEDLDDYYKLRVIVDFVSGMTDKFALNHYKRISGREIA